MKVLSLLTNLMLFGILFSFALTQDFTGRYENIEQGIVVNITQNAQHVVEGHYEKATCSNTTPAVLDSLIVGNAFRSAGKLHVSGHFVHKEYGVAFLALEKLEIHFDTEPSTLSLDIYPLDRDGQLKTITLERAGDSKVISGFTQATNLITGFRVLGLEVTPQGGGENYSSNSNSFENEFFAWVYDYCARSVSENN